MIELIEKFIPILKKKFTTELAMKLTVKTNMRRYKE